MLTKLCGCILQSKCYLQMQRGSISQLVLGIECTFDDTGAAVVNQDGKVLGEALSSQNKEHVKNRGVDPRIAQKVHMRVLPTIVEEAMKRAQVSFEDLDAIATATKPGNPFCLRVGLEYSKEIVAETGLPFIPVHHMEAHLLTARLDNDISFPFLTLLASGGHCIICLSKSLGQHLILGEAIDEPPGAVFHKVAREMRLAEALGQSRLECGSDVEKLALLGDRHKVHLTEPMRHIRSCDMSFSGIQTKTLELIQKSSEKDYADIAASFQHNVFAQIITKLHRGIVYCQNEDLLPQDQPTMVASGGVICNAYLRNMLKNVCDQTGLQLICPPRKLCTDNGIMIAWAGMEYWKADVGISSDPDHERFHPRAPLGTHIGKEVERKQIPNLGKI